MARLRTQRNTAASYRTAHGNSGETRKRRLIRRTERTTWIFVPDPSAGRVRAAQVARAEPLRIVITEGVIEPLPFAVPAFIAEGGDCRPIRRRDHPGGRRRPGRHRAVSRDPADGAISRSVTSFDAPVHYADWKAINAQALITGAVATGAGGAVGEVPAVRRVLRARQLGEGLQFAGTAASWRRMATRSPTRSIPGSPARAAISTAGWCSSPRAGRRTPGCKRLAIMDYDGANVQYLTDSSALVLAPRFSPTGDRVLYTSYETGSPQIYLLDVATVGRRVARHRRRQHDLRAALLARMARRWCSRSNRAAIPTST